MGHLCRFCCRERANERFSGKGHRQHICKDCQKKPKIERERLMVNKELEGYLFDQSRISRKNKARLRELMAHSDEELSTKAGLIYEVSLIAQGKRRRWKRVKESNRELFDKCVAFGMLFSTQEGDIEFEHELPDNLVADSDGNFSSIRP